MSSIKGYFKTSQFKICEETLEFMNPSIHAKHKMCFIFIGFLNDFYWYLHVLWSIYFLNHWSNLSDFKVKKMVWRTKFAFWIWWYSLLMQLKYKYWKYINTIVYLSYYIYLIIVFLNILLQICCHLPNVYLSYYMVGTSVTLIFLYLFYHNCWLYCMFGAYLFFSFCIWMFS